MNPSRTNVGGWGSSAMRQFMQTRLYDALPITWQSMVKHVRVNASLGDYSTEITVSDDTVYLPCLTEATNNSSIPYSNEGAYIPWYTSDMLRAKFRGYVISDDAEYYDMSSDPTKDNPSVVKFGDIWRHTGNSNMLYTYVDADYISRYSITPSLPAYNGGGWIVCSAWWTRSPSAASNNQFWLLSQSGAPNNANYADYVNGVCPCFSI